MIKSKSKKIGHVVLPVYSGDKELSMLPINLAGGNRLPKEFKKYLPLVKRMIRESPVKEGIAYLTVHEKLVKKSTTQRRGGPHVDGNYIPVHISHVGDTWGGDHQWGGTPRSSTWSNGSYGSGWKVGDGGAKLTPLAHSASYMSDNGGLLIVSNYSLCKGYNGEFDSTPRQGGDCGHLDLSKAEQFILEPNTLYKGNSQFVHESLPTDKDVKRVLVRLTLPKEVHVC